MTGPEHYVEAERLLALLEDMPEHAYNEAAATVLAKVQAHATLAHAAAVALGGNAARTEWFKVAHHA